MLAEAGRLGRQKKIFTACVPNAARNNGSPEPCLNMSGVFDLSAAGSGCRLCVYCDHMASRSTAPFKVFGDKTLMAIATTRPTSLDGLRAYRGCRFVR
jgi:hypothetical protein